MASVTACLGLAIAMTGMAACGSGASAVPIESGQPCAYCRMTIADLRLSAEIVAPGEDPRFYDDIGCLAHDLEKRPLPAGGRAFVADYRTGLLVAAETAVYSRVEGLATPMMSHYVAHADEPARAADGRVRDGVRYTAVEVFGQGLTGGRSGR